MERFTKIRNIGRGNMGACYLMRNNEDQRYYVIKQIDLAKMSKKERQQALNEARVLSALKHPNIINYVDSFLAKRTDHLCIVMEYAEGGDIAQRIKSCRGRHMREEHILDWHIQTCLATNAIHQKHILHRDIKTQNVFLTSQGVCKIGDFGIARVLQNTFDQAHTFVGTPYYLSPELVQEKPYDARSDTWALGVVLYEMMALRHPFNAGDMKSLMTKILRVQYEAPPSFYSQELRDMVLRTLVRDPKERMSLSDMLQSPLVSRRIHQWLTGGSGVAQQYVQSMVQHRLLPGFAQPSEAGQSRPQLEELPHLNRRGSEDVLRERPRREDHRSGVSEYRPQVHQSPSAARMPRQAHRRESDLYDGFGRRESGQLLRGLDHWRHAGAAHDHRRQSDGEQKYDQQRQRELQKERELLGIVAGGGGGRPAQLARLGGGMQQQQRQMQMQHAPQRPAQLPRMPQLPGAAPQQQILQPMRDPRSGGMPARLPPQQLPRHLQQVQIPGAGPHPPPHGSGLPPPRPPRPLASAVGAGYRQ
eukprot:TRINITY_DN21682_c0_g1_i1.p1 TRINITY_DN21682_c0_g1~~TRINITY_DN21682_c0_g1_i1.p1  ORF type:complete len:531 (+),score=204.59 TRINITY_DN21682_c0_g1_i1:195-1787(+)